MEILYQCLSVSQIPLALTAWQLHSKVSTALHGLSDGFLFIISRPTSCQTQIDLKHLTYHLWWPNPKHFFYRVATTITNQVEFRQGQTCAQVETMPKRRMAKQSTFHKPYFNNSQFIHYHVFLNCYSCWPVTDLSKGKKKELNLEFWVSSTSRKTVISLDSVITICQSTLIEGTQSIQWPIH